MSDQETTTEETTEDDGKVAIKVDKDKYVKTKSSSGKASLRRDEPVAEALAGLDMDADKKSLFFSDGADWYSETAPDGSGNLTVP